MITALWRRLRHPEAVSADWLRHQDRQESRVPFDGVSIQWPIKKLLNESPVWNRAKLKARDTRRIG